MKQMHLEKSHWEQGGQLDMKFSYNFIFLVNLKQTPFISSISCLWLSLLVTCVWYSDNRFFSISVILNIRLTHKVWSYLLTPHYGALGFTKELIWRFTKNSLGFTRIHWFEWIFSHTFLRIPYYLSNFAWTSI